ncbi:hypothetical protein V498_01993 [Pseudogymnoascus sp. VKM F-4517 (FW-2822)]|nr:hypothetical protein V498_01993 [Pseudogymnoascus sp. VKM F-4517 (FW-2822)]
MASGKRITQRTNIRNNLKGVKPSANNRAQFQHVAATTTQQSDWARTVVAHNPISHSEYLLFIWRYWTDYAEYSMAARRFTKGLAPMRLQFQGKPTGRGQHARHLIYPSSPPICQTIRSALSQYRQYSTPPPSQTSDVPTPRHNDLRSQLNASTPPHSTRSPPPRNQRRLVGPMILACSFLLLGITMGKFTTLMLAPPPIPSPESPEGQKLTSALRADAEALPLAKSMVGEEWEAWDAYTTPGGDGLANRLTSGPLAGYGGIGYQRVFYNKTTGEYVVLAWLGRRLSGWPGVVHGGLLATLLDECLARTGMRGLDGGVGVTARLELGYKRPVKSAGWWVVRSWMEEGGDNGTGKRKAWVKGAVEDLAGSVYTEGRALGAKLRIRVRVSRPQGWLAPSHSAYPSADPVCARASFPGFGAPQYNNNISISHIAILHVPRLISTAFYLRGAVEFGSSSVVEARGKANGKIDRRQRLLQPAIPVALECGNFLQTMGGERRERGSDFGATVRYDGRCGPRVLAHMVRVFGEYFLCRRYGSRFTESQKADVKLHCTTSSLYHIAYTLEAQNSAGEYGVDADIPRISAPARNFVVHGVTNVQE